MHSEFGAPTPLMLPGRRRRTVHRARREVGRDVDRELALEVAVGVEHLDAAVAAIADVDVVVAIDRDACGVLNCPGPLPFVPHYFTQSPLLSYLATRELT